MNCVEMDLTVENLPILTFYEMKNQSGQVLGIEDPLIMLKGNQNFTRITNNPISGTYPRRQGLFRQ